MLFGNDGNEYDEEENMVNVQNYNTSNFNSIQQQ